MAEEGGATASAVDGMDPAGGAAMAQNAQDLQVIRQELKELRVKIKALDMVKWGKRDPKTLGYDTFEQAMHTLERLESKESRLADNETALLTAQSAMITAQSTQIVLLLTSQLEMQKQQTLLMTAQLQSSKGILY